MGHYLHIFRLLKAPQGLGWRQIAWKQFPLLSPPHTPKNLNYRSGPLRGEPLPIIIQLLISTSRSWLSPSRNVSSCLTDQAFGAQRSAWRGWACVSPASSLSLTFLMTGGDCLKVSCPPSPQFSSSASPDCLNGCIRFPITFWGVRNHWVFLISTLESSKPGKASQWVFLLQGQDWNFSCPPPT